jgi:OHCU decarboxylase
VNILPAQAFVDLIGPVFEHSPWIAESIHEKRPFASRQDLHHALCAVVEAASDEQQLALIRAHPDLVGRAATDGMLTRESTGEQAAAGLNQLSPEEIGLFQQQNAAYHSRFGFPFVICARLNKKAAILAGFKQRLQHSRGQEIKTALEEIFRIADFRLRDLILD